MIHIVTVHWKDDRWIDIQLDYIERYVKEEFRIYAFLNDISAIHNHKFFYVSTEPIESHPIKLNLLADIAAFNAVSENDWLIFLDGDAFPIGDLVDYGGKVLGLHALAAVQRKENNGDIQPHPCFCLTTIGFWKSIHGDWKSGYKWRNDQDELVTDVGGNLLRRLEEEHVSWYPMTRSNRSNLHPVFFGIYDGVVYHHGSGFRSGMSRMYILQKRDEIENARKWLIVLKYFSRWRLMTRLRERILERWAMKIAQAESKRLNSHVSELIEKDRFFFRMFQ